ncbi:MAG TPA: DUF2797 domain-containing protein [Candidatus Saccharimonadales bacterium]|nr:DUF2797 domain-containing protein [Candidatus Saccharimonadales bacterium]
MPDEGTYLLGNVGFSSTNDPLISLQKKGTILDFTPHGHELNLVFDTSARRCIGWGDLTTGERFVCPDAALIADKYEQCPACQKRTGFNPAFYHATSVSKQQEARNQEPHLLYLAYFGPGVIKVGISHARRGNSRLLEQGARAAIILETFPTAILARHYEEQIAKLEGIAETIQLRKKEQLLLTVKHDYDSAEEELLATKQRIETALSTQFKNTEVQGFDHIFFPAGAPKLVDSIDCTAQAKISGKVIGMVGSILFCTHSDVLVHLPIKKLIGYPVELRSTPVELSLPAQQVSLF